MSASKLKNIALLILLLTNLFLLAQVVVNERRSAGYREAAIADAIAILQDSGISVARESVPDGRMPSGQSFERDRAAEAKLAAVLLGEAAAAEVSGGAGPGVYRSERGTLRFYSDGAVEAELAKGAYPVGTDATEQHALRLLKTLGFEGRVIATEADGQGETVTVEQSAGGWPVFSCTVRCTYTGGELTALSGRRVTGTPAQSGGETLNAATLLVRFRNAVRERGVVCSAILSMEPGYEMVSAFSGPSRLVPMLLVKIDGNRTYLLNMESGELKPA